MAYLKQIFNDRLFLKIYHIIWSIPCFILAVWMLTDYKRLTSQPSQIIGILLLLIIGAVFLKRGLSEDIKALKKSRHSPVSDIFFFIYAAISFVPAVIVWKLLKLVHKNNKL